MYADRHSKSPHQYYHPKISVPFVKIACFSMYENFVIGVLARLHHLDMLRVRARLVIAGILQAAAVDYFPNLSAKFAEAKQLAYCGRGDAEHCAVSCRIEAEKNNWYRLQRAVEIVLVTGQPTAASAVSAAASDVPYDYRTFFLFRPRIETFRRIDARVEQMVCSLSMHMCSLYVGMNVSYMM